MTALDVQPRPVRLTQTRMAALDRNAPRYTSYPTAARFTEAVGEGEASAWLAALPEGEPVSLYVHLPFCKRLCWYCGCNTRAVNRAETITGYVRLLDRKAQLVAEAAGARLKVGRLHLGGGTPNMLSPGDLDLLFGSLGRRFDLSGAEEIAAELDPAVLTREWVQAAARHGLTRASLGVQDLSARVQQAVNRPEPFEVVERAAAWLRGAGVRSLNLDLMYGLPTQTTRDVLNTLEAVLTLRPDRIALFGYAHVPWMKANQRLIDESALPNSAQRLAQSRAAADRLWDAGWRAIGIDHFALPDDGLARAQSEGRLRRNFQGYTDDQAEHLIGLGASSISRLPGGFVQNAAAERAWRDLVGQGRLPTTRGVALSARDRLRAEVIERLMCDFSVDLAAVCARHDEDPQALSDALRRLAVLRVEGLVEVEGLRITATAGGRRLVRLVAAAFDDTADQMADRHARVS